MNPSATADRQQSGAERLCVCAVPLSEHGFNSANFLLLFLVCNTESLEQCDVRQLTGSTHHTLPAMVFGMLR